jgi:hypothetical protein
MNLNQTAKTRDMRSYLGDKFGYERVDSWINLAPFIAAAVVLALLGYSGLWITKNYYARQELPTDARSVNMTKIDFTQPNVKELLIAAFIEYNGGLENWAHLESISYNGVIFNNLENHSFVASKTKTGDTSLYVTNRASETTLEIKNGVTELQQLPKTTEAPGFYVKSIAHLTGELYSPLVDLAVTNKGEISELEESIWQNMPVVIVTIQDDSKKSKFILYSEDLSVLARIDQLSDGATYTYRFTNYESVNGLNLAKMVNAENNLGDSCNIRFTEIKPLLDRSIPASTNVNIANVQ